jgi:histidyl-tRNA synthetase
MQFDADTVGSPGVAADAEMCMMMADVMEALGIKRGDYVIRVNNRKVLDGVMEAIGLGGDENAGRRLTVLRAIDKLDKFGPEGVKLLLGPGAGMAARKARAISPRVPGSNNGQAEAVLVATARDAEPRRLISWSAPMPPTRRASTSSRPDPWSGRQAIGDDRIKIDPPSCAASNITPARSSRPSCSPKPNENGQIVRFGSVGGGGRYDGLVSRFRGEPVPATGFSIGVSRLMTALKNLGKLDASDVIAPVVVLVMDKDTESLGRYQKMVSELRAAGIRSEMYLGGAGMKAQLKYADRRGSPVAVIQGGDERARGELQIKDLIEGARMSAEITDNAEWRAARPAQVTVAEGELVAEVKKILAAQAADRAKGGASRPSDR